MVGQRLWKGTQARGNCLLGTLFRWLVVSYANLIELSLVSLRSLQELIRGLQEPLRISNKSFRGPLDVLLAGFLLFDFAT